MRDRADGPRCGRHQCIKRSLSIRKEDRPAFCYRREGARDTVGSAAVSKGSQRQGGVCFRRQGESGIRASREKDRHQDTGCGEAREDERAQDLRVPQESHVGDFLLNGVRRQMPDFCG